jgi:methylated-DNA-[protein]-cysteine S-methyltransferase
MPSLITGYFISNIGPISVTVNEMGVCDLSFEKSKQKIETIKNPVLQEAYRQLTAYFAGKRKVFNLPLSIEGTAFQKNVWQSISEIPFGKTLTYSELAVDIKKPKAIRAAASACGKNQVPIIIPCHRILGKVGLGGFTGGLPIKRKLLDLEGISYKG